MRLSTAVLGAAMVMWASAAAAQAKPDFSGKWTVDTEKTSAANPAMQGGGGGAGGFRGGMTGPMTITQDAATLTTVREGPNGAITTAYKLDGTETTVNAGGRGEAKAKAAWEGNTLVIMATRAGMDGNPMTTKTVYALEGEELVVTLSLTREGAEIVRKTFYKKG